MWRFPAELGEGALTSQTFGQKLFKRTWVAYQLCLANNLSFTAQVLLHKDFIV